MITKAEAVGTPDTKSRVSLVRVQTGLLLKARAKVTVQEVSATPEPTVTRPAVSVPTMEGLVPQEETVGMVPVELICEAKVVEEALK